MNLIQTYIEYKNKLIKMEEPQKENALCKEALIAFNWVKIELVILFYFLSNIILLSTFAIFQKESVNFYELFLNFNLYDYEADVKAFLFVSQVLYAILFSVLTGYICDKSDRDEGILKEDNSSNFFFYCFATILFLICSSIPLVSSFVSIFVFSFCFHNYSLFLKKRKELKSKNFTPIKKIKETKEHIKNIEKEIINDEDSLMELINLKNNGSSNSKILLSLKERIVEHKKSELNNNDILSFNLKNIKYKNTIIND